VLTSIASLPSQYHLSPSASRSPDDVYDSHGSIVGGADYHPHYSSQIPNGAKSKRPDRTYTPPPSGYHYSYDQANHTWTMEADSVVMGTSLWNPPPSGYYGILTPNSSGAPLSVIIYFTDGTPASA
jgi:hypothetical protein